MPTSFARSITPSPGRRPARHPAAPHRRSRAIATALSAAVALALATTPTAMGAGQASLVQVRAATARFHDVAVAEAAGYGAFYVCTDEPGEGAMGQHFVNLGLVVDGTIDAQHPEAMVYTPAPDGGYQLVAVEYLAFAAEWDASHTAAPHLFGRSFGLVEAPNRYGLPAFYELHAWIWRTNPSGMFYEWNPRVTCPA